MTIIPIDADTYNVLLTIQKSYPNLTYQNKGYDYPDKSKWTDEDNEAFKIVTDILSKAIKDFVEFNHFIFRKRDNKNVIALRFQYQYDSSFTGVGYIALTDLLNEEQTT